MNKPSEQTLEEMIATFEIYSFSNVPRENLDGLIAALTEWKDKEVLKEVADLLESIKLTAHYARPEGSTPYSYDTIQENSRIYGIIDNRLIALFDRIASLTKGNHD